MLYARTQQLVLVSLQATWTPVASLAGAQALRPPRQGRRPEARTGALGASTGDTAPGDQGALPGKVMELNGGNSGVTSGARRGRYRQIPTLARRPCPLPMRPRGSPTLSDYDAAKAAYDAARLLAAPTRYSAGRVRLGWTLNELLLTLGGASECG